MKDTYEEHARKLDSLPFVSEVYETKFIDGIRILEYMSDENDSRVIMFRDEADIKTFLAIIEKSEYKWDFHEICIDPKELVPKKIYIFSELPEAGVCSMTSKEKIINLLEKQWNEYTLNLLKLKKKPRNEKWTYVTTARHVTEHGIVTDETITDDPLHLFDTKEEAYETALRMAEDEKESLNEGLDRTDPANGNKNFTVIENEENMDEVKILFYEDENGHGEELVTRRTIKKVEAEQ